ncbi:MULTISPECIES: hypothetical protein [unclassified Bartonella]
MGAYEDTMKSVLGDVQICLGICLLGDAFGAIDEQRKIGGDVGW